MTQPGPHAATVPSRAWLALFSARSPAGINADGSATPYFTKVLAWVFEFDSIGPIPCAGGPGLPGSPGPCDGPMIGESTEIVTVDAMTGQALTNETLSDVSIRRG